MHCVVYAYPTFYFKKSDSLDVLRWNFVGKRYVGFLTVGYEIYGPDLLLQP